MTSHIYLNRSDGRTQFEDDESNLWCGRMDTDFEQACDSLDVDFMLAVCATFGLLMGFVDWVRPDFLQGCSDGRLSVWLQK
jgi:hypothetical protein